MAGGEVNQPKIEEPDINTCHFTVGVFGETGSGKTSLLRRLMYQEFYDRDVPPLQRQIITFVGEENKQDVCLDLWDIPPLGSDVKATLKGWMTPKWCKYVDAYLLVFALDNQYSFEQMRKYVTWIKYFERMEQTRRFQKGRQVREPASIMIVGNKSDVDSDSVIHPSVLRNYFQSEPFFKCSAKDGAGVFEAFEILSAELVKRMESPTKYIRIPYDYHLW